MPARREYALVLVAGAAGAALVLLAVRQAWAHVVTIAAAPLPASTVTVRGADLVPAAGALGLAALAGLAAVIATRGAWRRLVGAVLAAFGTGIAVAVSLPLRTSDVLSAAAAGSVAQAGSVTAGSGAGAPGTLPGAAVPGTGLGGHVAMVSLPWREVAVAGALALIAAGLLAAWRGTRWPVMPGRFDQAGGADRGPAGEAGMWDSLSRGADPTDTAAAREDHRVPGGRPPPG